MVIEEYCRRQQGNVLEMASREPRRSHDAFLFEDVVTIVPVDDGVDRLEVQLFDKLLPATIEPKYCGNQIGGNDPLTAERSGEFGPGRRLGRRERPQGLDRPVEGRRPGIRSCDGARPLAEPQLDHVEQLKACLLTALVEVAQGDLEVLAAAARRTSISTTRRPDQLGAECEPRRAGAATAEHEGTQSHAITKPGLSAATP